MHPLPPRRTTHAFGTPKNLLVYDRWGRFGRPMILLHGLRYDRTMWWPVAAELHGAGSVLAVDLPGHGESAPRDDCAPDRLAHDLAMLVLRLDLRRAPVLVAHAESALLAEVFAARYATHTVIAVDTAAPGGECDLDGVPEPYRQFAVRRPGTAPLRPFRSWSDALATTTAPAQVRAGALPEAHLGGDRLPHLRDPAGFAGLLRGIR
ncbi:alpha/beta hydrolase [Actinoplanes sp. NPDC051851]|uniref:alpha/beta fold hydrolase n=1 Tax=Actinoplanes sp. NPDC051851 TaxID=3154753 RepID=UPI0034252C24